MVAVVQRAQLLVQRARVEKRNNYNEHNDHKPDDVYDEKPGGRLGLVQVAVPRWRCRISDANEHERRDYNQT